MNEPHTEDHPRLIAWRMIALLLGGALGSAAVRSWRRREEQRAAVREAAHWVAPRR